WFPTYWQEFFNKPLAVAGGFTMLYSVLASVIRVPGGIIADKVGGIATIIVSMTTTLVGGILLIWGESMAMAVVGLLLMAIGMGISNAGVFKLVPQYIEEAVGGGSGWVGGLGALGGFVIPPVMGWFVEA
ncbi:MAG: MFS transporter, partial [Gammaproteobacteria bacterium]|nr:MFS transporter [Gammaproteobacteria bacterium]NIW47923.1 MFS transporter [Gammaproteobacteria bacterium]NIX58443.1 MFS transporter [candidate division Zixibacteria bacterium]